MGHGSYSFTSSVMRSAGYATKSTQQIFVSRKIDPAMDPKDVDFRECRDSSEHPNPVPIIIALDVTGSMGHIPDHMVRKGLTTIVASLMQKGIENPQILFMGIGDYTCDDAPLQVGQFESSDELLDKWLSKTYLEGGGGGNNWESYSLAWLFAARHTVTDPFVKRGQKGFLFTIGDEPLNPDINGVVIQRLTKESQGTTVSSKDIHAEASKMWEVFHIHVDHDGRLPGELWQEIVGQHLLRVLDHTNIPKLIASTILANKDAYQDTNKVVSKADTAETKIEEEIL